MFLYALFSIGCLIYILYRSRKQYDYPPAFPGALPLIGHAHMVSGDGQDLWKFVNKISKYGAKKDGTYIRLGPKIFYVICNPDDYKTIMDNCLEKNYFYKKFLKAWIGQTFLTASVPLMKRYTKMLSPAFSKGVFSEYMVLFNSQAKSLVKKWEPMSGLGQFDPKYHIRRVALETIILTTLGLKINEGSSNQIQLYMKSIDKLVHVITQRVQNIWIYSDLLYNLSSLKKIEENCLKVINAYSKWVLQNKREADKNEQQPEQNNKGKSQSFLDLALQLTKNDLMSDQLLLEHINGLMFASYHTVSATLNFILVVIGSYKEVQNRIYNELHEVLRGTAEQDITVEQLSKLVYMDAVINETARLYPAAPVILRHLEEDVKLQYYTMKAGCNCVLMLHELNRCRVWGPDRDQFRPERWLEPGLPQNANDFTGFGAGRRACLGRSYAILSLKTILAHLIRRFKFTADHTKLKMSLEVSLEPAEGHGISIEPREQNTI